MVGEANSFAAPILGERIRYVKRFQRILSPLKTLQYPCRRLVCPAFRVEKREGPPAEVEAARAKAAANEPQSRSTRQGPWHPRSGVPDSRWRRKRPVGRNLQRRVTNPS